MIHLPRVMLAAPASGSGKTMLTCGILQTFKNRGLNPASFKCGPDYIDPMFHSKVIGTKSRNLDCFFTEEATTRHLFARTAVKAGISVLEGVMGIYDGLGGTSVKASSYDLAAVTDTPVILVINARGMSLSVIPMICGYLDYQKRLGKQVIRGVILNQMTKMTYLMLKEIIEEQTGIQLYGYVPRLTDCIIESRHLGLVTPDEITDLQQKLQHLSGELEQCLDFDGIAALAHEAADYEEEALQIPEQILALIKSEMSGRESGQVSGSEQSQRSVWRKCEDSGGRVRIAVAMDEAFCFYYQDNLELLKEMNAEIIPFSPLHEEGLPEKIGGLILGGGYPELYAGQLSENVKMRAEIHDAIVAGMPYLAECGGFMYLHEEMEDMTGHFYPMCGCIEGRSFRTPKLSRFGYIQLSVNTEEKSGAARQKEEEQNRRNQLLLDGAVIHGHEFHYFDSTNSGSDYRAKKPAGRRQWECIHGTDHSAAGYPHLYYWSNPAFAAAFVQKAREFMNTVGQIDV